MRADCTIQCISLIFISSSFILVIFEPQCKKTYLWTCAPNEDSNYSAHLCSLIRIFIVIACLAIQNLSHEDSDQMAHLGKKMSIIGR